MLRQAEKDYYSFKLESLRSDIKGTWKVLREIPNGGGETQFYPKEFKSEGRVITNITDIVNGFNNFLSVPSPKLAGQIPQREDDSYQKYMPDTSVHSFFLSPVAPDEVLNEVKKFKSKKSYGYDNVDMNVLKGVIDHIVEPITHICNRSSKLVFFLMI